MSVLEETMQSEAERFQAIGEDKDLRLVGENLSGGALVIDDRVVNLCVIRVKRHGMESRNGGRRLMRASLRHQARRWE